MQSLLRILLDQQRETHIGDSNLGFGTQGKYPAFLLGRDDLFVSEMLTKTAAISPDRLCNVSCLCVASSFFRFDESA